MSNYEAGMWIWSVLYGYGHVSDADTFKQSFYGDNNYAFVHIDGVSAVLSLTGGLELFIERQKKSTLQSKLNAVCFILFYLRTFYFAGLQTGCTYIHLLSGSVHFNFDGLYIGLPHLR